FVGPAILDGRGNIDRAFGGGAVNVTIESLEVRNYNPGRQNGAIEPGGDNWTLRNVDVNHNGWGGIYIFGNNVKIIGGKVNDHAGLGIGDSKVTGTLVDGTEIARNGFGESCGVEAGGITIPSSCNVGIYANVLDGNCNGTTGTQQDRTDSTPPAHLLKNLNVHDNVVNGPGSTGVVEDNGADLSNRGITFVRNVFGG